MGLKDWIEAPAAAVVPAARSKLNLLRGAAARLTTPLLARRLPAPGKPAVVGARTAWPDRRGAHGDRGLGDDRDQAGLGIRLQLPAGAVHRDRPAHRRAMALAVVLAHLAAELGEQADLHRGQGDARGFPVEPPRQRAVPSGTIVRLATPPGNFALPDPPPEKILFLTAGSGITPVMAMLRTMNRRGQFPTSCTSTPRPRNPT